MDVDFNFGSNWGANGNACMMYNDSATGNGALASYGVELEAEL